MIWFEKPVMLPGGGGVCICIALCENIIESIACPNFIPIDISGLLYISFLGYYDFYYGWKSFLTNFCLARCTGKLQDLANQQVQIVISDWTFVLSKRINAKYIVFM